MIVVSFTTVTPVAAAPPMVTEEGPTKFAPVIVTGWPPASKPEGGLIAVTEGIATNVYSVFAAFVPLGVVTSTLAVRVFVDPSLEPVCALIVVAFTTENACAATPSIATALAPIKFVPVIVTDWPANGPNAGVIAVTVGAA